MSACKNVCECLPKEFGCVVFTGVGSVFLNQYFAYKVAAARKKHGVDYPTMYSPDNKEFNCVQRAHQNYLENYPQFVMLLTFAGLKYPRAAASFGGIYLLGRFLYAQGYYTGEPKNRRWGAIGYVGLLGLLGTTLKFAWEQCRCCGNACR